MRRFVALVLGCFALVTALPAEAQIVAKIDRSSQTMRVWVDGVFMYEWLVSTGARGHATPTGSYRAQRLAKRYFSRKYDNAPMHNAVFFHGGYAIHGTSYVSTLGQPASHGCVRLHPSHAEEFFELVRANGMSRTRITITH